MEEKQETSPPPRVYDCTTLPRECKRHYISASEGDLEEMLRTLKLSKLRELFSYLPKDVRMEEDWDFPQELSYGDLEQHLWELSRKNNIKASFIGGSLPQYEMQSCVPLVSRIRKLTTAYTPYQPERSQGTLATHWIYQSILSAITGFEAINASLYDRSSAAFEAIKCAQRLRPNSYVALVAGSLYPNDIEVLQSHARFTDVKIEVVDFNRNTGLLDVLALEERVKDLGDALLGICFPQVNRFGILEEVDSITDMAHSYKVKSIALIDPILLGEGALKSPKEFGKKGAHMFVAEGQHLAIPPNFGGPSLGIFGIRFHEQAKVDIRQTAGRFVGKAKDRKGKDCYSIVLSTREQHIRREKATSNICSNQAFVASLAGAALLQRGPQGLRDLGKNIQEKAHRLAEKLCSFSGVELAYPQSPFFHEFVIRLPSSISAKEFILEASQKGLHVGVDVSSSFPKEEASFLRISISDMQSKEDFELLEKVFREKFSYQPGTSFEVTSVPERFFRKTKFSFPQVPAEEIYEYYKELGEQNVSPDENIYSLGSCTMKYNPYINDYAANLKGFAYSHPQAPLEDVQANLEVLYEIQEYFKSITGLPAVTTEPVAGAQGELVGLKMFQAYHWDRGESRDIVLIPKSAHGTNPATAVMAGFSKKEKDSGVHFVEADRYGQIDMQHLGELIEKYSHRIAGVMVTNPNTSGIFEIHFKEMADRIHEVGGLVYMDGANMNAIAGWVDLKKMGVDAVHNNIHKTWSIPHGGGGPGDAIVAVSDLLVDYLPGKQVRKINTAFVWETPKKSIGTFHRDFGNFAHKVRCYTYLRALGREGIRRMSAIAVLSSCYVYERIKDLFPTLPKDTEKLPRMHEFIISLSTADFERLEAIGLKKSAIIPRLGKLFLDFGLHAPTVAFPESFGLMIEPTESYSKSELERFIQILRKISFFLKEHPEVLHTVPHFTPIDRVDEVYANKNIKLSEPLQSLSPILKNRISTEELDRMKVDDLKDRILQAHHAST